MRKVSGELMNSSGNNSSLSSFISGNSYQQIVLPPTQAKGTDLLKMWDAAVENQ